MAVTEHLVEHPVDVGWTLCKKAGLGLPEVLFGISPSMTYQASRSEAEKAVE